MEQKYRSNIPKYFIYAALSGASLGTPIVLWVIFLQKHYGFSLTEVTLIDVAFWLGKFFFEIPTGIVADRYGRKVSLALGAAFGSMIWVAFTMADAFWLMATAQFIGGIIATFGSGASEAILFETMKALGREDEYAKIAGRAGAIRTVCAMLSGVAVGVIAEVNLVVPLLISSVFSAAALIPILSFTETIAKREKGDRPKKYSQIVGQAVASLRQHVVLRWAMAYMLVLGSLAFYVEMFLQPYAIALPLPIAAVGLVMVAVQIMSIVGSLAVPRAQKLLGTRAILYGAPILLIPCLLLIGSFRILPVLIVVMAASFLFALTQPVLLAVIQGRVPNEARATLLSIQSLLFTVFLSLTEPPLGIISDAFGVYAAYLVMGVTVALFCVPLLSMGRRWLHGHSMGPEASRPVGDAAP